jgi:signal transduction histidine kinase
MLLGGWFRTGWQSTKSEAKSLRAQPEAEAREDLNTVALALSDRLRNLLLQEDERPYYHYKNLFHDPSGRAQGLSVNLSPLVESTGDPLIAVHFQIGSEGKLTIPPINEDFGELSLADALPDNQDRLLALRAAQDDLLDAPLVVLRGETAAAPPLVAMQQTEPRRPRRPRRPVIAQNLQANAVEQQADETPQQQAKMQAMPQQQVQQAMPQQQVQQAMPQQQVQRQQVFEQQAFAQNSMANTVFEELENRAEVPNVKGSKAITSEVPAAPKPQSEKPRKKWRKKTPSRARSLPDTDDKSPVQVTTHPFSWRTTELQGTSTLIAMRRIDTPTGKLTQGFVVGVEQLSEWLIEDGPNDAALTLQHPDSADAVPKNAAYTSVQPLEGWVLATDFTEAQASADARAAGLRAGFLWKFLPATFASMAMLVMLVMVVARAEALARERSQFAAAAAHELRTPLAGLQLYGDMLADGLGDKDAKDKYARHIADEAQRLGRVVSNVLDFSQMEQKGLQLRVERRNLADTVRRVAERMKHGMDLAGMKLQLEVPEQVEANYDDDAVYRILQNLMDNAEKYSRDHEDRTLRLSVVEEDDLVRVSVSDGGPGVVSQMRQQIFKPFRRAGGSDSPAGLGLGLALARSLARQQGGNLRAEESAFGGARFVLEVPKA